MTIIYPVNGKNERMGQLFKTPKHLLLYKGVPAIKASIEYMAGLFYGANIIVYTNADYRSAIPYKNVIHVSQTNSQVETLLCHKVTGQVMFVDCDIIPLEINKPNDNTVYLFKNEEWMKQYSNYKVRDGKVVDCNEKGEFYEHAGAGIYYFEDVQDFYNNADGCTSISQIVKKIPFNADITSKIFRFGTLNDITNG